MPAGLPPTLHHPPPCLPPCIPARLLPCSAQLRGQQYKAGVQYISQYEFAVEPPTLRQAVLPSKHAGNPHAYLRELNRVSARGFQLGIN